MGVCKICQGGGGNFFGAGRVACREAAYATRGVARRLLGEFGSMLLRGIFFKWCNLVRFEAYFHNFLLGKK